MLTAATLLTASPSARAGEWALVYQVGGSSTDYHQDASNHFTISSVPWTNSPDGSSYSVPQAHAVDWYAPNGSGSVTATAAGTIQVFAQWIPSNEGEGRDDPPPGGFWVHESAVVDASASGGVDFDFYTPFPTLTVVNPLGSDSSGSTPNQKLQRGELWRPIDNSDHKYLVPLTARSFSATASLTSQQQYGYPNILSATANVGYSVQIFAVPFISAYDIDTSYHKGAGGTREENKRGDDGSITADSAVSFNETGWPWEKPTYVLGGEATYTLNQSFPMTWAWGIAVDWSLAGNCSPFDYPNESNLNWEHDQTIKKLKLKIPGSPTDPALNATSILKAHVPAEEGWRPNIDATYTVRWHLPFENWTNYGTNTEIWEYPMLEVTYPGHAFYNGSVHCKWSYGDPYNAFYNETVKDLIKIGSAWIPGAFPLYKGLATAASLVDFKEKAEENDAIFSDCWNDEFSTFTPPKDAGVPVDSYQMEPVLRIGYTVYPWKADAYDSHGYAGEAKQAIAKYNHRVRWSGNFTSDYSPP